MSILNVLCLKRAGFAVTVGLLTGLLSPTGLAQVPEAPASSREVIIPKIVVVEGEAGVNAVKERIATKPVVEVRDQYDLPIAGASVEFALPKSGPGGVFARGARSLLTVVADSQGRASMDGFRLNGKGAFQIFVTAEYRGHTSTASIAQTNFANAAAAQKAGKTPGMSTASPTVKLPAGATAFSGGSAALTLVAVGGAGAATYFLLKNKTLNTNGCASNILTAAQSALQAATSVCDNEGDDGNCVTDISYLRAALDTYCSSSCPLQSVGVAALQLLERPPFNLALPSSCHN